jgi:hypothetical protein
MSILNVGFSDNVLDDRVSLLKEAYESLVRLPYSESYLLEYAKPNLYFTSNNVYASLNALRVEEFRLVENYKNARTLAVKQRIVESYHTLCAEIRKVERKISKISVRVFIKSVYKIAASFKSVTNYFIRNLRFFFRSIIRFYFKNMDDNSGFDYFFQPVTIEKNIYNQNFFPNGTASILRINK